MVQSEFVKGQNVTIRLDSVILGGVTKAVCKIEYKYREIREFLSDTPVDEIVESIYRIELTLNSSCNMPFLRNRYFGRLEMSDGNSTVIYSDCRVDNVNVTVNSRGAVEYDVRITAGKRDEL